MYNDNHIAVEYVDIQLLVDSISSLINLYFTTWVCRLVVEKLGY